MPVAPFASPYMLGRLQQPEMSPFQEGQCYLGVSNGSEKFPESMTLLRSTSVLVQENEIAFLRAPYEQLLGTVEPELNRARVREE